MSKSNWLKGNLHTHTHEFTLGMPAKAIQIIRPNHRRKIIQRAHSTFGKFINYDRIGQLDGSAIHIHNAIG